MIMDCKFYRAPSLPAAEIEQRPEEWCEKMHAAVHSLILGNECDVLRGPEDERDRPCKAEAFMPTPT